MSLNLMTSLVLNYSISYQRILDPNIKYYSSKIFMSSDKLQAYFKIALER